MKTRDLLATLQDGQALNIRTRYVDNLMTGVAEAQLTKDGTIRLFYEGGSTEAAPASEEILDTDTDDHSLFDWVSCVQGQRVSA